MGKPLKIAAFQPLAHCGDEARASEELRSAMASASAWGAIHLVAPELYMPGYDQPDAIRSRAEVVDGPFVASLRETCKSFACGVTVGFAERDGQKTYNSAISIDRTGSILNVYRKIQLFGEQETSLFAAGDSYTVFDLEGIKTSVLICYDVEFMEHWRALERRGVQLILAPTANMQPYQNVSDVMLPARAADTNITVAYANYCGRENDLTYCGRSLIAGSGGRILGVAGDAPTLLLCEVSPSSASDDELASHQASRLVHVA